MKESLTVNAALPPTAKIKHWKPELAKPYKPIC